MGNTEEVFNFYKTVFGGEFTTLQRLKDTPDGGKLSPKEQNMIMHVALPIGKGNILMGTDMVESMGHKLVPGNNVSLSIQADSEEEARDFFSKISAGGKITMPLEKAFWDALFGMCNDKFGIQWMVNYSYSK